LVNVRVTKDLINIQVDWDLIGLNKTQLSINITLSNKGYKDILIRNFLCCPDLLIWDKDQIPDPYQTQKCFKLT
jgi:hypothetical protein